MIALDTNVLVRLIVNDDKRQVAASLRVLRQADRVLLMNTVLLETVWVLQSVYGASREDVLDALQRILFIVTPEGPVAARAVQWFGEGMDFADALHLAAAGTARCDTLHSFNRPFVQAAAGKAACAVAGL